ncbi:hypothetical protein VNO80_05353 [Phaseolus coccineus]|uniref:Uncharacterized protein n=1 Tax=Phaseolus coccineus TaxID=3886 RepID=A0AAN9NFF7_PHACN
MAKKSGGICLPVEALDGTLENKTVQAQLDTGSPYMVKFAASLNHKSIVDVEGYVMILVVPIKGTMQ